MAPNGTNLGLFKISFSTFWLTDLEKSQIYPFGANLTHFGANLDILSLAGQMDILTVLDSDIISLFIK